MKKIGFIDLYIDEWHANNYPAWIKKSSKGSEFEVAYAWEESPKTGGLPLASWCDKMRISPARSLEEIVEKSDCLCVLSPSNPEAHERLADLALASGKPTYIDKPFAVDRAMAERLFRHADESHAPLMSSSSLRYSDELQAFLKRGITPDFVCTTGGGSNFPEYAIHQVEMIVAAMGTNPEKVTVQGTPGKLSATVQFSDGRSAVCAYAPDYDFGFHAMVENKSVCIQNCSRIFENLLEEILNFYSTGIPTIPREQTLSVAAIRDALVRGMKNPGRTIDII